MKNSKINKEKTVDIEPQLIEMMDTLEELYLRNLLFFKENYPKIYKKLEKLHIGIEAKLVSEKFKLEYNTTLQSIDILDVVDDEFIYNQDIYEYAQSKLQECNFKKSKKLVFVGVLLGTHIGLISKDKKAKYIMIFEESYEIFRLSLFVTDYKSLTTKSELFFSLGKTLDDKKTQKRFNKFKEGNKNIDDTKVIIATSKEN